MSARRVIQLIVVLCILMPVVASGAGVRARAPEVSPAAMPQLSRLTEEVQISSVSTPTDATRHHPSVAYDSKHRQYLVVWHNDWPSGYRDIYAQRLSNTGALVGSWFSIPCGGSNSCFAPSVVYNATNDEFFVVWLYDQTGILTHNSVQGRAVAWNGSGMGTVRYIETPPAGENDWDPRIAWNSYRNQYMVVWGPQDTSYPYYALSIKRALLDSTGGFVSGGYLASYDYPHQPDIAYNVASDEYLVVWRVILGAWDGNIWGRRLGWDGTFKTLVFPISELTRDEMFPAVATNSQNRYLVVWQKAFHTSSPFDWDIIGQELDIDGNKVDGPIVFAQTVDYEENPAVACDGAADDCVVVWDRETATGRAVEGMWYELGSGAAWADDFFSVADYFSWTAEHAAIAADVPGYLIAYEGEAPAFTLSFAPRHIYGRMYWRGAAYVPVIRD